MKPLIELQNVSRYFTCGEQTLTALDNLTLTINSGEFIAITGTSGSGKSTLLNILGCLDRTEHGRYLYSGQDITCFNDTGLARLRAQHFGFIFQQYNLLPQLDALSNVEVPAVYAGQTRESRERRARSLLNALGLQDRLHHRPAELSGGQQRVSIARALVNGAEVILADEPTGALDKDSRQEVLEILKKLHAEGHTVIIVTHDADVASHADRVIQIANGAIDSDTRRADRQQAVPQLPPPASGKRRLLIYADLFAFAWRSVTANKIRTFLTMLGIIIGIASVVTIIALGQGARTKVLDEINSIGTNTIDIFPGEGWGDERADSILTLNENDLNILLAQPYLKGASPQIPMGSQVRWHNRNLSGSLTGVSPDYFTVKGLSLIDGRLLNEQDIKESAAVAVIEQASANSLFAGVNPLNQVIFYGDIPVRVVGIVKQKFAFNSQNVTLWLPYTTVVSRIKVQNHYRQLTVRLAEGIDAATAEKQITDLLTLRHGKKDFFLYSNDVFFQSVKKTNRTITLLLASVALISLVVGGIGIMNMMFTSVVERTREIGVRLAVGARRSDILLQFLAEAVTISILGGSFGIVASLCIGMGIASFSDDIPVQFSGMSLVVAFIVSCTTGIIFGFIPARNAARLQPVQALSR